MLRQAVEAIPAIGGTGNGELGMEGNGARGSRIVASAQYTASPLPITKRLKRLDRMFGKGLLTEDEFKSHRARILSEI